MLSLTASRAVEGFMSGRHRSPHRGVSVEFVERRPYVQGDDLRHLDWKAFARNDRLSLKRYEEETNLECTLIVDASGSMGYPDGATSTKYDYACQVAVSLAHLVLRDRDGAAMAMFDHVLGRVLPASTSPGHLEPMLAMLSEREPDGETDFGSVLGEMSERIRRPGLVVLISDLFGDVGNLARGLDKLCTRNHDTIVLHIMHSDELNFPFERLTRFEGMEEEMKLLVDAASLRESYLRVVEDWRADVRRACHGRGVDYHLIDTDTPLDVSLSAYLGARTARLGKAR
jgi:uncharacterized protein (DUF58 family)